MSDPDPRLQEAERLSAEARELRARQGTEAEPTHAANWREAARVMDEFDRLFDEMEAQDE